ncbi:MAG: PilN domain-containing protein, partial [Proteobacteria bacterium]|nr:PilN domain-containing protein [Pseudomonadota bacterium]
MTTAEMIRMSTSFVSGTAISIARMGRLLREVLFFSLADDRIAPKRRLSVLLESGGVSIVYRFRFLSRMKTRRILRYPFEAGAYPPPENLATTVALAVNALKAAGAETALIVPKAWTIVKTAEFPLVVKDTLSDVIAYELDRLTPLSPERAFYDFRILAEDEDRIRILVAAIKAERLQPYLDALKEKGITIGEVGLSAAGAPDLDPEGHGSAADGINLLDRGIHRRPKTPMALTALLLALLLALGLFWLVSPLQLAEKRAEMIDREIAARKDEVRKVEALKKELDGLEKEIAAINAFRTARPLTLDLLKEMTRILPENVWLSRVRFTESAVEIEGYAASATGILPKLE